LTDTDFNHACLKEADFGCSKLVNSNLSHADLEGATFNKADMKGVDLSFSLLINTDLDLSMNLSEAKSLGSLLICVGNVFGISFLQNQLQEDTQWTRSSCLDWHLA
jgi:uncharacterized protein YjbI with pentapeptide repeats